MTELCPNQGDGLPVPPDELVPPEGLTVSTELATATIGAVRIGKTVPDAYRLVTKGDGNGDTIYVLQGYFTWTQGWSQRGGVWRDLETQDWLTAQDDIPFGPLG